MPIVSHMLYVLGEDGEERGEEGDGGGGRREGGVEKEREETVRRGNYKEWDVGGTVGKEIR